MLELKNDKLSESLTTEIAIFRELRHPNLVTCYGGETAHSFTCEHVIMHAVLQT
eukprot:SAG11_NODE_10617_length_816_cov_2.655509_2_plen_54_part_00